MKHSIFPLLFLFLIFFCGCEKNTFFQSKSKIEGLIEHRWHLIQVSPALPFEDWIFSKGKVCRLNLIKNDTTDLGDYSVRTTFSDAYLNISNFKDKTSHLNSEFTINEIDEEILVLAGPDAVVGAGSIYREFTIVK